MKKKGQILGCEEDAKYLDIKIFLLKNKKMMRASLLVPVNSSSWCFFCESPQDPAHPSPFSSLLTQNIFPSINNTFFASASINNRAFFFYNTMIVKYQ